MVHLSCVSTISHQRCPIVICASCMREVRWEGTLTAISQSEARGSPVSPVSAMVRQFNFMAASAALITFADVPLVLRATRTSPPLASAWTWRAKTSPYPKSLLSAVRADVSVVRAIDGQARLSSSYLPTSSAAMCWASAALPPFPQSKIFWPWSRAEQIISPLRSISMIRVRSNAWIASRCSCRERRKSIATVKLSDSDELFTLQFTPRN